MKLLRNIFNSIYELLDLLDKAVSVDFVRLLKIDDFDLSKTAIVIRGPLSKFTIRTVKRYLKTYNVGAVVVSTWEGERLKDLFKFKDNRLHFVSSDIPVVHIGKTSLRYQTVLADAGLKAVREKTMCSHALLLRSDIRANNFLARKDFYDFYYRETTQKNKLIVSSFNTMKDRLMSINDLLMFGNVNQLIHYWKDDYRSLERAYQLCFEQSIKEIPETILALRYYESIAVKKLEKINYRLYENYMIENFVLLDPVYFGLQWNKYHRHSDRNRTLISGYQGNRQMTMLDVFIGQNDSNCSSR